MSRLGGRGRGVFDQEKSDRAERGEKEPAASLDAPTQMPMSTHASDYYEPGRVAVAADPKGGVIIEGDPPPDPPDGLTDENLVCAASESRPPCRHYIAILGDAEGVTKGAERQKQVRRFCRALSTASELMDLEGTNVYACTAREPQDLVSADRLVAFERQQKAKAAEQAAEGGSADL